MKITKAITKWLLGAALASAFILAAPNKAQAQVVVEVGHRAPAAVAYYTPAGYGWHRREYRRWEAPRYRWDRFHDRRVYRRY
jgi:hypothetical protein